MYKVKTLANKISVKMCGVVMGCLEMCGVVRPTHGGNDWLIDKQKPLVITNFWAWGYCRARVLRPRTFLFPLSPTIFFNCIYSEILWNKNEHSFTFTAVKGCLIFCKPDIFTPLFFSFQEIGEFTIFVK